jgi:anti-sigma regulatory factor (Ser/Thr protein kinase)
MDRRLELELRADPSEAKRLRNELHAWLLEAGINGQTGYDIATAATEAFLNAIEHPAARGSDQIAVFGVIGADRRVIVEVSDDGHWQPHSDPERDHLGYSLMRATMDSVETSRSWQGTRVTLKRQA